MRKFLNKTPDPHFPSLANDETFVCEEMVEYSNIYLSKYTFVKKLYVGLNGVIAILPLQIDDLDTNKAEQKRCKACLEELYESIGLHLYVYPVFSGQERCFFVESASNFFVTELGSDPYEFADKLCKYTCENKISPSLVSELMDEITDFTPTEPERDEDGEEIDVPIRAVLDSGTVERIITVATYMENNERPQENVKFDEDGTQYILRDSALKVGINKFKIDTGLVGKKAWFRLSDEDPRKYALAATLLGWLGAHKFLHGDVKNGLLYLVTFGFAGIMPAVDLLSLFSGSYSYSDVFYEDTVHGQKRTVEKVYMKKAGTVFAGIGCMIVCLGIGYLTTKYIYPQILDGIMSIVKYVIQGILPNMTT